MTPVINQLKPIEITAWFFCLVLVVGIPTVFFLGRSEPSPVEVITVLVIDALMVAAAATAARDWRRLVDSRRMVASEEPLSWEIEDQRDYWGAEIQRAICRFKANCKRQSKDPWPFDELPSIDGFIDPVRDTAEASGTILRWASSSAVLFGLIGTLFALMHVIPKISMLLANVGNGVSALDSMESCFISSATGVIASLSLGLLRAAYDAAIQAHFADLKLYLLAPYRLAYDGWQPPTRALTASADSVNQAAAGMQELAANFCSSAKTLTTELLGQLKTEVGSQAATAGGDLKRGITEGVKAGTSATLALMEEHEKKALQQWGQVANHLAENAETFRGAATSFSGEFSKLRTDLETSQNSRLDKKMAEFQKAVDGLVAKINSDNAAANGTLKAALTDTLTSITTNFTGATSDMKIALNNIRQQQETTAARIDSQIKEEGRILDAANQARMDVAAAIQELAQTAIEAQAASANEAFSSAAGVVSQKAEELTANSRATLEAAARDFATSLTQSRETFSQTVEGLNASIEALAGRFEETTSRVTDVAVQTLESARTVAGSAQAASDEFMESVGERHREHCRLAQDTLAAVELTMKELERGTLDVVDAFRISSVAAVGDTARTARDAVEVARASMVAEIAAAGATARAGVDNGVATAAAQFGELDARVLAIGERAAQTRHNVEDVLADAVERMSVILARLDAVHQQSNGRTTPDAAERKASPPARRKEPVG